MRKAGFADFAALAASGLPRAALELSAEADALQSLALPRRPALWRIAGLERVPATPLFVGQSRPHPGAELSLMSRGEEMVADYRSTVLSLRAHPCALLREKLTAAGAKSCAQMAQCGAVRIRIGGIVTVRPRPGTAKGTVFI